MRRGGLRSAGMLNGASDSVFRRPGGREADTGMAGIRDIASSDRLALGQIRRGSYMQTSCQNQAAPPAFTKPDLTAIGICQRPTEMRVWPVTDHP